MNAKQPGVSDTGRRKAPSNNLRLWLFSIFLAVACWVYIAVAVNPDYEVNFYNVPIQMDITNSRAEAYGLSLLHPDEQLTTDVTIAGSRTALGGLTKDDLIVSVDFDTNVDDMVGTQLLSVKLKTKSGYQPPNVTFSRETVEVQLDRYETKQFPVSEVLYPNISLYDDEMHIHEEAIVCEPSTVAITGPSSTLATVDHVRVTVTDSVKLYQTRSFPDCATFSLINADGKTIDDPALQVQTARFAVTIPVTYSKTLPVSISLSGVPSGFDSETVLSRLRLSTDSDYQLPGYGSENLMITIETDDPDKKATLDELESWNLGVIPLSSLSLGGVIEIPVQLDEGYADQSNLGVVNVKLDESNLVAQTRLIQTKDIAIVNGSSKYQFNIKNARFEITLIGTPEELEAVSSSDIIATVNLYNASITEEGSFDHAVTFTLPDTANGVWVSGTTKVTIDATLNVEDE